MIEQKIKEILNITYENYNKDLHRGDLTRTKQIKYKTIIETLEQILEREV